MFSDDIPRLIVDPEGVVYYKCPVVDQNNYIHQWVQESNIDGIWYDGIFYFKNKEDRNLVRILL